MSKHTKAARRRAFRAHHGALGREAMGEYGGRGLRAFIDAVRPAVMRNLREQDDAPCDRDGDGWSGTIGGACPLQGDGVVDGLPWYFRARGEAWSFSVAATPDGDAVAAGFSDAPDGSFYTNGPSDNATPYAAGWMPHSEAWRHIEESIAEFRAMRGAR